MQLFLQFVSSRQGSPIVKHSALEVNGTNSNGLKIPDIIRVLETKADEM